MDTNTEPKTYRNYYGDLMCAVHHSRMMMPRWRKRYSWERSARKVEEPWCVHCRSEGADGLLGLKSLKSVAEET